MPEVVFVSVCIISAVVLILIPVYLRNRLQQKQLETLARAIELGIDPEKVRGSISPERSGDVNGNWKAGVLLVAVGLIMLLAFLPTISTKGLDDAMLPFLFVIVGGVLLYIHYSVVGKVVKIEKKDADRP